MNTTLYYFSGTGNSYFIAKELQKKLGDCELLPITNFLNQKKVEPNSKKIGIVFPLYFMSLPEVEAPTKVRH